MKKIHTMNENRIKDALETLTQNIGREWAILTVFQVNFNTFMSEMSPVIFNLEEDVIEALEHLVIPNTEFYQVFVSVCAILHSKKEEDTIDNILEEWDKTGCYYEPQFHYPDDEWEDNIPDGMKIGNEIKIAPHGASDQLAFSALVMEIEERLMQPKFLTVKAAKEDYEQLVRFMRKSNVEYDPDFFDLHFRLLEHLYNRANKEPK